MVQTIVVAAVIIYSMYLFFALATMPLPVLLEHEINANQEKESGKESEKELIIESVPKAKEQETKIESTFGHTQTNGWRATSHFRDEYCEEKEGYYAWENTNEIK